MPTEKDFAEKIALLGGQLYIVGGWVRDSMIGRAASDKDYVVCGVAAEELLKNFPVRPVGRQFPVFILEISGRPCEVALARTERKTGSGYRGFEARFSPETTIEEDLFRRDTTMNSMALRLPAGELVDPFGGRVDIAARRIRATSEHFREDPVRALRAARQAAQLGFWIEERTVEMMRACRSELAAEPSERIFCEMEKALRSPRPEVFFAQMRRAGILDAVFPELDALAGVEQPVKYHGERDAFEHSLEVLRKTAEATENPETRFAALVHYLGAGLTPREMRPHHDNQDSATVRALDRVNARMTLPRRWLRTAKFAAGQLTRIPQTCRAADIVEIMEQTARLAVDPRELLAVVRADSGVEPDFLVRYEHYQKILAAARQEAVMPENLPPNERGAWLKMRLADALTRRLSEEKRADADECPR